MYFVKPSYIPLIFFYAQIILKLAFYIVPKSKDLNESGLSTVKYVQIPETIICCWSLQSTSLQSVIHRSALVLDSTL